MLRTQQAFYQLLHLSNCTIRIRTVSFRAHNRGQGSLVYLIGRGLQLELVHNSLYLACRSNEAKTENEFKKMGSVESNWKPSKSVTIYLHKCVCVCTLHSQLNAGRIGGITTDNIDERRTRWRGGWGGVRKGSSLNTSNTSIIQIKQI